MEQLRTMHGELQHVRMARTQDSVVSEAAAESGRAVGAVEAEWGAKIEEVTASNAAVRGRLVARHDGERAAMEEEFASQFAALRPRPATADSQKLWQRHEAATKDVRRGLRAAARVAPGAGIDVSDLDVDAEDTSDAVKELLRRSASLLASSSSEAGGAAADNDNSTHRDTLPHQHQRQGRQQQ